MTNRSTVQAVQSQPKCIVKQWPLFALAVIKAANEDVRWSSKKSEKVYIGRSGVEVKVKQTQDFYPGDLCVYPVWNQKSVARYFNLLP